MTASTSGMFFWMSARYRSTKHPATISRWARPVFLYSAISRMVSTDSCLAGSIKLHVLTTMTSASEGCGVSSWPELASWPIMTSVSTRFFGHPRLTNPIFKRPLSSNVTVVESALLEILLVIFLGAPELGGGHDLGHDGPRKTALRGVAGGARFRFLFRRVIENDRTVLRAHVRPLPVQRRRVVIVPEDFEQVVVADYVRVKSHLDHFG